MTIVYCIFSLAPPGGMQRTLTVKANYLADITGCSIHIVTRSNGPSHFHLSPNINVHYIGKDYRTMLTSLLYDLRPDITISLYGEEAGFLYKINDGSKKILEFHFTRNHLIHLVKGLPNVKFRPLRLQYARLLQYKAERCVRHYDRLVLLTEGDRALWRSPANAVVIPNPLSFTSSRTADLHTSRILSTGRLIATKGFDLLIDAFRLVAMHYPEWRLSIFGEGQDKEFLTNKIRKSGLEERIHIHPPTADIAAEMLNSDVYAAASRYEGFGLVITEAMECGVPCVAFDCECGPREIISDGVDGILVEPLNTEKFAEALLRLIGSPALRKKLGKEAKVSAGRFAVATVMRRWEILFDSLVEQNTSSHVR